MKQLKSKLRICIILSHPMPLLRHVNFEHGKYLSHPRFVLANATGIKYIIHSKIRDEREIENVQIFTKKIFYLVCI